ncbi:MAG: ABC transporter ATP-binding protein [Candidatus Lokiarchaeota archaeon]|nr:ABC transporter ATP-binding protein [Candidatus Lokiarchaeota archaeon]
MTLVRFSGFYYRYKGNEEYALNDVNLEIEQDRFILLAGETGSGKTSLIRCLNGLIPQFYPGFYKGSVQVDGKSNTEFTIAELSTIASIVFQNPENQLIAMNVEHEIAFGLENLGVPAPQIKKKIDDVVKLTEIGHLLDKAPFELSGGEQQRVAIASILALEPKILVLDEPTALLDPGLAQKILILLKKIQVKKKMTVIISEHRMDIVLPLADDLILMKEGKVIEYGAAKDVINGCNFKTLCINRPVIYSIFEQLSQNYELGRELPSSIPAAIKLLKEARQQ